MTNKKIDKSEVEIGIDGVGVLIKTDTPTPNRSHVYVISTVPNAVTFLGATKYDSYVRPDGTKHALCGAPILTIDGTHTKRSDKETRPYVEQMIPSDKWEEVLKYNSSCHYIKNGNIKWFNTRMEAIDAAENITFNKEFRAYTGLERIDSSKLDKDTLVQHKPGYANV